MRSLKKMVYVSFPLLAKVLAAASGSLKKPIQTMSRRSSIFPEMVGLNIGIHNGKSYVSVFITENMVGHKLGEFALTRKAPIRKSDTPVRKPASKK